MSFRLKINLKRNDFRRIARQFPVETARLMNNCANNIIRVSDRERPKDSGALGANKSIKYASPTNLGVRITWNQLYAIYVHEGRGPIFAKPGKILRFKLHHNDKNFIYARKVGAAAPNPFVQRAVDEVTPRYHAALGQLERQL